jgi:pyridoxamine 5'-phosphate oxidase
VHDFVPLREEDVDPDPVQQFATWFEGATQAGVRAPEAAAVATATPEGLPSVRMVLVKQFDERGFVFFTSYESRKGQELAANPHAALLFYWPPLERRVAELAAGREGANPPLPETWGGFRLVPESFEFWQNREDRLHDRLRYAPGDGDPPWKIERLAP